MLPKGDCCVRLSRRGRQRSRQIESMKEIIYIRWRCAWHCFCGINAIKIVSAVGVSAPPPAAQSTH